MKVIVAPDSYKGDWQETAGLTADGEALRGGELYSVVRENDTKILVPAD